jgi:hypothetical protein
MGLVKSEWDDEGQIALVMTDPITLKRPTLTFFSSNSIALATNPQPNQLTAPSSPS